LHALRNLGAAGISSSYAGKSLSKKIFPMDIPNYAGIGAQQWSFSLPYQSLYETEAILY
jgi:hypothetical protein